MHKNEATEEYVDNILAEEQHRIELIAEDLKTLKHNINLFLQADNENSIFNLCTFLNDANFIYTYNADSEIAYCIVAAYITAQEFNDSANNILFLRNLHSIEEVVHEITEYKFNIINIEFNTNRDNALNELYTKISSNKLSIIALKYFINNFSINKKHVLTYISDYFRQNDSDADYIDQFN